MVWTIIGIVLGVIAVILVVLYFVGRKLQKKQGEQAIAMENAKQVLSVLVIDKKMMKIEESGLPAVAKEQMPKYLRWKKLPVVKVKYGPKVMTMIADKAIFDILPVKKEVKVEASGLYITGIKSVRNGSVEPTKKQKKAGAKSDKKSK